jgi:hypothetical protein
MFSRVTVRNPPRGLVRDGADGIILQMSIALSGSRLLMYSG